MSDETPKLGEFSVEIPETPETPEEVDPTVELQQKLDAAEERLTAQSGRLLQAEIAAVTREVLADPTDLLANVDRAELVDEDGNPDAEKITAAASALIERKKHLAFRRVTGDIGQGARGSDVPDAFNFGEWLQPR